MQSKLVNLREELENSYLQSMFPDRYGELEIDDMLDRIYDTIDDLMESNDLDGLNFLLGAYPPSIYIEFAIGLLTASLPLKYLIPNRAIFFERLHELLTIYNRHDKGLLDGLK